MTFQSPGFPGLHEWMKVHGTHFQIHHQAKTEESCLVRTGPCHWITWNKFQFSVVSRSDASRRTATTTAHFWKDDKNEFHHNIPKIPCKNILTAIGAVRWCSCTLGSLFLGRYRWCRMLFTFTTWTSRRKWKGFEESLKKYAAERKGKELFSLLTDQIIQPFYQRKMTLPNEKMEIPSLGGD